MSAVQKAKYFRLLGFSYFLKINAIKVCIDGLEEEMLFIYNHSELPDQISINEVFFSFEHVDKLLKISQIHCLMRLL